MRSISYTPPYLTPARIRMAYAVAITVDVLEWVLGPFGFAFSDEILDVLAMILIWRAIGFHPLLLPAFVIEFLPIADLLPTWTGCVALVVMMRKRQQGPPPSPRDPGPFIDV
ncbi:MAG TPA: hypothetical protein VNE16_04205 [Vicinamibacterales bacterium]|nr:hypothetical protein [Vicinamibacterales bacterium]